MRVDLNKTFVNYVSRCKFKEGNEIFETTHLANDSATLCGKNLDSMWFIVGHIDSQGFPVTCKKCLSALNKTRKTADI